MSDFNPLGFAQILFAADADLSTDVILEFARQHSPLHDEFYPYEVLDYYRALQFEELEAAACAGCTTGHSLAAI
ncbi:MAG: hypothetical protein V4719_20985 [Planctomycetota bacterium]